MEAEPKVTVDGDAEKGWLVQVHDGNNMGTYSPEAADADAAGAAALDMHKEAFSAMVAAIADPSGSLTRLSEAFMKFRDWAKAEFASHKDEIDSAHAKLDRVGAAVGELHEAVQGAQTPAEPPPADPPEEHHEG